jgi:hypothetical protein
MLFSAPDVRAGSVSTQGLVDVNSPEADGSTTGDILTATSFELGHLVTNTTATGFFTNLLVQQDFGSVSFTTNDSTSLSFSNTDFGTFQSSSFSEKTAIIGAERFVNISVTGTYTAGTFPDSTSGPATVSITLTQSTTGGAIAAAGSLSVVPEPTSMTMGLTSIAVCGLICGLRRRRTSKSSR